MERIIIENFSWIKKVDFEIKSMNIFIWPSWVWKSITIKLLYFFKWVFDLFIEWILEAERITTIEKNIKDKFKDYFPISSWWDNIFYIKYINSDIELEIKKLENGNLDFKYNEKVTETIKEWRKIFNKYKRINNNIEKEDWFLNKQWNIIMEEVSKIFKTNLWFDFKDRQFFIPAWRSFFANIQNNIFSLLKLNQNIDPFLIEFWSIYERYKDIYLDIKKDDEIIKIISELLDWDYIKDKKWNFFLHKDWRRVKLENASSWQQEALPIFIVLNFLILIKLKWKKIIYIEEPEAHLFPTAQKKIVEFLAFVKNKLWDNSQIFITTHSPYILTSFNNLIYAWNNSEIAWVDNIINKNLQLKWNDLSAYSLEKKWSKNIIDKEFNIIWTSVIDEVSDTISNEFNLIMELDGK